MAFWDDDLLISVEEVDNQHRDLCNMASELLSSFAEGKTDDKIEPALIYFENYIKEHFDAEEKILEKVNFPYYEQHKEEHDKFKLQIQKFREILEREEITENFVKEFNLKIVDWLIFHVREMDGLVAKFIKEENKDSL